ncbi:MAG: hypothetical protein R3181_07305 [Rubricoccaceae bacterium]|nr:hypothetical protein [Rubricoccaceae bacterium]
MSGVASRLTTGDIIPSASNAFYELAVLASFSTYSSIGQFPFIGEQGYAGVRFIADDDQRHFGWLRIGVTPNAVFTRLYGYAFESTPDTPIAAGDTGAHAPDLLLDGSVNQTSFPPEGGTLTFSGTVSNTTDEEETLDLWAVARRLSGTLVAVRRFDPVTVPPGATAPVEASADIRGAAPSGTAEVKFHAGTYPRVVDSETFTLTKEPRPGAVESGPLFSGAEADGAPLGVPEADPGSAQAAVSTHALSAPAPNPTTGRSALTLSVAEAQHVAVSVLDALGREVARLHDGPLGPGREHRLLFDGSGLPAGVYAVRAVGEAFSDVRVLSLAR